MSQNVKKTFKNVLIWLPLIAAVLAAVIYVTDIKAEAKENATDIKNLKDSVSTAVSDMTKLADKVHDQDKGIQKVQDYIEFGILPRLELDKKKILEEAAKNNVNGSSTSMQNSVFSSS